MPDHTAIHSALKNITAPMYEVIDSHDVARIVGSALQCNDVVRPLLVEQLYLTLGKGRHTRAVVKDALEESMFAVLCEMAE